MPLADSNVWLALALSKHTFHGRARAWFAKRGPREVLFCRAVQQSVLRLLTTDAVLAPYGVGPLTNRMAWAAYDAFLADERVAWVEEPRGLESIWRRLAAGRKASPKLWMDAYLASFALAGGHGLATTDKAFKQFNGLDLFLLTEA
jgi:toxin-antitoxin system PIN domain toxin